MTLAPNIDFAEVSRAPWDAVVIGAGPAGALAARQLALLGGRVLLVERKAFPRRKVCGACVSQKGIAALASVGLGDLIRDLGGQPLTLFRVSGAAGRLELPLPGGVAVSRAALDAALARAAMTAGAFFLRSTAATVGECQAGFRQVQLQPGEGGGAVTDIRCGVVLAADGLGSPSLAQVPDFSHPSAGGSRIGAGCEIFASDGDYAPGIIHMAVGRRGYLGLAVVETGALNIAAALDPQFVQRQGGLATAAASILAEAKFPPLPGLLNAAWRGTPALTRSPRRIAAERLFLVGDAAGYVEPFTGEGITWALLGAAAVAPLAAVAWNSPWDSNWENEWRRQYAATIGSQQRFCRVLARLLQSPWCVSALLAGLSRAPYVVNPLVRWVCGHQPTKPCV